MPPSFPRQGLPLRAPGAVTDAPGDGSSQITLRIEGDLDATSIPSFRDVAFTAIGKRPSILIIDMTQVPFVDTAGLAALVTVARVARMVKVPILIQPAPHLRRVLHTTGLVRVLTIVDEAREKEDGKAGEPKRESE